MMCKEFNNSHKTLLKQRYPGIKEGGHAVLELLKETCKVLKVSQGQPDWKAYVDFVNNAVVEGIVAVVRMSLQVNVYTEV